MPTVAAQRRIFQKFEIAPHLRHSNSQHHDDGAHASRFVPFAAPVFRKRSWCCGLEHFDSALSFSRFMAVICLMWIGIHNPCLWNEGGAFFAFFFVLCPKL
jgi:hypothetical protein